MSVEPIVPPVATEVPKTHELDPKFEALARQQKAFRREQEEFKAQKAAMVAKQQEYETNYVPKSRLKEDAYSVLSEIGVPYDTVVSAALQQDPQSQEIKALKAQIKAFEERIGKNETSAQEAQKKQYEQAVENIRSEVKSLVDKDTYYEAIKANDASEAVVELIKETFEKTGKLLSKEDAAKQVEDYLFEQAKKLAGLEKIKKLLNPEPPAAPPKPQGISVKPRTPTLTNQATTAPAKPMSEKDRRARAIAAITGQS